MAPLIILMYALSASSFAISKVLLSYATPLLLSATRMLTAGSLLVFYQRVIKNHTIKIPHDLLGTYAQIIVLGMFFSYTLRFWGLSYTTSSKAAFLFTAAPFFTALFSYFFFNERLTLKQRISLVIGFMGLIPVLITTSPTEQQWGELFFISIPELAILTCVALYSYGWVLIRKLVHVQKQPMMLVSGLTMIGAGLLALPTALWVEGMPHMGENIERFIGWLALTIMISDILGKVMYIHLLKRFSATFISFCGFLSPIFAALYGWSFLRERITWHFFAGMAGVILGLALFYQDELAKKRQKTL